MDIVRVEVAIHGDIKKVWEIFTNPKYIVKWNFASDDWECPYAKNDLKTDGRFVYRMTAKDKSASFNFSGKYKEIFVYKSIIYALDDKRQVSVTFEKISAQETKVIEIFQPERINPVEMQRAGWQAILNNFKKCVEENNDVKIYDDRDDHWRG